ncbi:MAG: FadR/GntR family transcriptional regulator [Bacteroidota bacterium]
MERIVQQKVPIVVAQQIEEYIKKNRLQPGARLPGERELLATLGVGRSSLREGLRILEGNGTIVVRSGKGTFVARPSDAEQTLRMKFLADKRGYLNALKIRRLLESLAVEEAIEHATEAEVDEIEAALLDLERAHAEGRHDAMEDKRFHILIYRASKNEVLAEVLEAINQLSRFWESPFGDTTIFRDSYELHRPIYEAIRARDKAAGRASVKKLLDTVEADIERKRA